MNLRLMGSAGRAVKVYAIAWLLLKATLWGCGPATKAVVPACPDGQYYSSDAKRCVTPE